MYPKPKFNIDNFISEVRYLLACFILFIVVQCVMRKNLFDSFIADCVAFAILVVIYQSRVNKSIYCNRETFNKGTIRYSVTMVMLYLAFFLLLMQSLMI